MRKPINGTCILIFKGARTYIPVHTNRILIYINGMQYEKHSVSSVYTAFEPTGLGC